MSIRLYKLNKEVGLLPYKKVEGLPMRRVSA